MTDVTGLTAEDIKTFSSSLLGAEILNHTGTQCILQNVSGFVLAIYRMRDYKKIFSGMHPLPDLLALVLNQLDQYSSEDFLMSTVASVLAVDRKIIGHNQWAFSALFTTTDAMACSLVCKLSYGPFGPEYTNSRVDITWNRAIAESYQQQRIEGVKA